GSELRTLVVFFFQAEDGIRDRNVTGVQTCALPISQPSAKNQKLKAKNYSLRMASISLPRTRSSMPNGGRKSDPCTIPPRTKILRSEERRVGKECRSRGSTDPSRKKEREESMARLVE